MSAVPSTEDHLIDEVTALARANTEAQAFVALLADEVRTRLKVTERALARADEEGLQIAGENTRTLQELVEDLLELAHTRPDARASAGEAMRLILRDIGDGVKADIVVGELPTVAIPLALLRTVLRNLIANALEASASKVEVFARRDGAICVRDDGPGSRRRLRRRSSAPTRASSRAGRDWVSRSAWRSCVSAAERSGWSHPRPSASASDDQGARHRRPRDPANRHPGRARTRAGYHRDRAGRERRRGDHAGACAAAGRDPPRRRHASKRAASRHCPTFARLLRKRT